MRDLLEFQGVPVYVNYSPRLKHSYLRVHDDETIRIKTPIRSQAFIARFLEEKSVWIQKQLENNRKTPTLNLQDEVLYFGEVCSIDLPAFFSLRKRVAKFSPEEQEKISLAYNAFYKEVAQEYLTQRAEYFARLMDLAYKQLKFRKMKSRWGSCSSKKEITFNTQLIKLKKEFIDYVVVHELAHLVHMNHSKKFHLLVESYLPRATTLRKELKAFRLPREIF
jgi:hypothetical protein